MADAVAIPGHKKKSRHFDAELDPEFQIAPMIDILLVLLVFFMSITSTEVLQSNHAIDLPVAKDAKDAKKNPGQVIVNVIYNKLNNATVIEVNEGHPSPDELVHLLQTKVNANPLLRVLIRADREVRYESMKPLLQDIGRSGVSDVTFSVVDKEANPKKS